MHSPEQPNYVYLTAIVIEPLLCSFWREVCSAGYFNSVLCLGRYSHFTVSSGSSNWYKRCLVVTRFYKVPNYHVHHATGWTSRDLVYTFHWRGCVKTTTINVVNKGSIYNETRWSCKSFRFYGMLQTFYWTFVITEWHAHFHSTSGQKKTTCTFCVHSSQRRKFPPDIISVMQRWGFQIPFDMYIISLIP